MNRFIFINSVLAVLLFATSCSLLTGSSDEPELRFEEEQYIVDGEVKKTYRSLDVISVRLKADTDPDEFNSYIDSLGLQPVTSFHHSPYSAISESQVQRKALIVFLLPSNADRSQFFSFSDNLNEDSFAKNRFIEYSLPAYSYDPENTSWYYPDNRIMVLPLSEGFSETELSGQFNLELHSYLNLNEIHMYTFSDRQFLHGSPYELAGAIYESGDYKYVVPNSFRYVSLF